MERFELRSVDGITLQVAVDPPIGPVRRGVVVLVHGLTVDMDEGGGMFVRLAQQLAGAGFEVVRFSFRGHGDSGGTQRGMTIAGECLDLQAVIEWVHRRLPGPVSIVAASFGAVSTLLSLPWLGEIVDRLVLWNPVLDLRHTFLEPELAWGIGNFGTTQQETLHNRGFLLVDGQFELGRVLFDEFARYQPLEEFLAAEVPALIVHGDQDTAVSYPIAAEAVAVRPDTVLHTVVGSDHGFDSRERENEAISVTVNWLAGRPRPVS
ncbi:alpha/beta hydrolase [Nocardia vaccinii]|uniref:alpha/beta hydrolase n=1 Tax=Nocardia vaccinii TaxID=1822 RepID=UPI0008308E04|nr:alpha/beta fold hydrolase [Nocardia vaccinii]